MREGDNYAFTTIQFLDDFFSDGNKFTQAIRENAFRGSFFFGNDVGYTVNLFQNEYNEGALEASMNEIISLSCPVASAIHDFLPYFATQNIYPIAAHSS